MNYLDILQAFKEDPIVKLKPSTIHKGGVGVFAVTNIAKDTLIFKPKRNYTIPWIAIPFIAIPYLKSICNFTNEGVIIDRPPNDINASYYVNHSDNPNLHHDLELDEYWSIRNIQPGEELTCYYLPKERDWNVSKS